MVPASSQRAATVGWTLALLCLTSPVSAQVLLKSACSGGTMAVSGGGLTLLATVGEAGVVGRIAGQTTTLDQGFWPGSWRLIATGFPAPPDIAAPFSNGLRMAAPNPFRDATTITYSVARASPVRLAVHDVTGRLVVVLAAEVRHPGRYSVVWDGRDSAGSFVASGVYFTRLSAGDWSQTRKMLKVR